MPQTPAVTIYENFTRPAAEIIKQFEVPTGYITDLQGRRGALDCGVKPLFEFPAIVGPALTVKTVPDDNLAVFAAMGVARAGDVLVIATDNWTGSAVLGDLVAAMFNNSGLAGVVTDGAARDVAGISQVGLPVFARGLTANSSQKTGPARWEPKSAWAGPSFAPGTSLSGIATGSWFCRKKKSPRPWKA